MPRGIYPRTEKGLINMSKAHKGLPSNRKGVKLSEETKNKIRLANIGKKQSPETIIKRVKQFSGSKSWRWKGGVTPKHLAFKRSFKYKLFRLAVLERDNFTCQNKKCGIRGGVLQVHHIRPFALFPRLRLKVSNGLTLCVTCHRATDTYGWNTMNKVYKK